MEDKTAVEILGVEDPDIQDYLKKHPEKAAELGQNLIKLDEQTAATQDRIKDLGPLNWSGSSKGGIIPEGPTFYRGFFKTPLIIAFLVLIAVLVIIEIVAFLITHRF